MTCYAIWQLTVLHILCCSVNFMHVSRLGLNWKSWKHLFWNCHAKLCKIVLDGPWVLMHCIFYQVFLQPLTHIRMNWENMCLSYVNGLDNDIQLWCGNYVQNRQVFSLQRLLLLIFPALGLYLMFGLFRIQFRLFYSRVDNIRHTSGYFFIENFIMTEIFKPSDKRILHQKEMLSEWLDKWQQLFEYYLCK